MSFLSKADFRTKEEWLKKQRKELMKRQSHKYHEFNSHPNHKIKQENTLSCLHTSQSETPSIHQAHLTKMLKLFKNDADAQLYKSMTERLIQKEQEVVKQRQVIKKVENQVQQIKIENAFLRGVQSAANELLLEKQDIELQNNKLKAKYEQMERYLTAHGVIWQQNKLRGDLQIDSIKQQIKQSKHNYKIPKQQQFQVLVQRIAELNESLRSELGESKYVNIDGVYKLQKNQEITLTFYKNGLAFGSDFYSYESKEASRSLGDLEQGYYPYVFKQQFPDGVVMNVVGQLDKFYGLETPESKDSAKWFIGKHYSLSED